MSTSTLKVAALADAADDLLCESDAVVCAPILKHALSNKKMRAPNFAASFITYPEPALFRDAARRWGVVRSADYMHDG
jgi:hypothetical protein